MKKNLIKKNIISLYQLLIAILIYAFIHLNTDFSFAWSYLSISILIFCYYMIVTFNYNDLNKYKTNPNIVCSIIFGLIYILGREYLWNNKFFINLNIIKIFFIIIQWIIISFIFYEFLIFIHKLKIKNNKSNYFMNKLNENNIWKIFLIILCCWIPYLILMYPTLINADSLFELAEFWGMHNKQSMDVILKNSSQLITSHHPVLYTYLIGYFSKFININIGLYLYNILQTLIVIYSISNLLLFVNNRIKNNQILSYMFIIICFYPFIPYLFISLEKDVLFACAFMFFGMSLYECVFEDNLNLKRFSISSILLVLLRNNVKYIFFLFLLILFMFMKNFRKKIFITAFLIVCSIVTLNIFCNINNITAGSKVEMLSIPLQQTARYVKYYENEVTNNEKEVINKVLDYKNISKKYKPRISDPIKNMFNDKKPSNNEICDYFKVWFKMFFKHPICYIEATLNTQIETFYPSGINVYTVRRSYENKHVLTTTPYIDEYQIQVSEFGFKPNNTIDRIGTIVDKIVYVTTNLPILGLISMSATYLWWAIIIIIDSINNNKWKNTLLFFSFYILYFFTLFLGPCDAVFEFRYIYPFFVSAPLFHLIQVKSQ